MDGKKTAAAGDGHRAETVVGMPNDSSPLHQSGGQDTRAGIHIPVACSHSEGSVAHILVVQGLAVSRCSEGGSGCFAKR